ncbi:MAG: GNAT family N-acetyltransferase [Acidimicrobiia bacterium]|nr:GNAT family N-acetyltransferase [Acidimicrobiia bacterium]
MKASETESRPGRQYSRQPVERLFGDLTAAQLHDILELRSRVFIVEQECVYHDIDGRDAEPLTKHVWIEHEGSIAAYLRVLDDGDGVFRIGRVVTSPEHRGHGLAATLMAYVITEQRGVIVLDAQAHLYDWYSRLGFTRSGADFTEDGIAHVPMYLSRGLGSHPVE